MTRKNLVSGRQSERLKIDVPQNGTSDRYFDRKFYDQFNGANLRAIRCLTCCLADRLGDCLADNFKFYFVKTRHMTHVSIGNCMTNSMEVITDSPDV